MYSDKDALINSGRMKKEAAKMLLCMLPFLVAAVGTFLLRNEVLCIIAVIAAFSVMIFFWDLRVGPLVRYRAFLREIHSGLTRETVGTLVRVGADLIYQDGVYSREVILNIYEDLSEEGERRFLLDCAKEIDEALVGHDVELTSHGSFVLNIEPIGA